jgi:hypothetical protein
LVGVSFAGDIGSLEAFFGGDFAEEGEAELAPAFGQW